MLVPPPGNSLRIVLMGGSFLPFGSTKEERAKSGDPRPSIAERYAGREEYLKRYEAAARELVKTGYRLERDVPAIVAQRAAKWDHLMK